MYKQDVMQPSCATVSTACVCFYGVDSRELRFSHVVLFGSFALSVRASSAVSEGGVNEAVEGELGTTCGVICANGLTLTEQNLEVL